MKKEKNTVKFTFDIISYKEYDEKESSETPQKYGIGNYRLKDYENYKFVEYSYNFYNDFFKKQEKLTKNSMTSLFNNEAIAFFWFFKGLDIKKKVLDSKFIKNVEEEINEIPSVMNLIKKSIEEKGYAYIDRDELNLNPEYHRILKSNVKKALNIIKNWLVTTDIAFLEKAFYTENLFRYLNILKVSDKNIRKIAEFLLYNNIFKFVYSLPYNKHSFIKMLQFLNMKSFNKSVLYEHNDDLFDMSNNVSDDEINNINLLHNILDGCFREFKTEEDFINFYLPKLKPIKLTRNDFLHVKQYDYIKSILQNALCMNKKGINILLYGNPGSGKTALSKVLIEDLLAEGYEVTRDIMLKPQDVIFASGDRNNALKNDIRLNQFLIMNKLLKENKNAIVLYDEAEDFFRKENNISQSKGIINKLLEENRNPVIWTTNSLDCMEKSFFRRFTYILNIDELPIDVYTQILNKLKNKYKLKLTDNIIEELIQYKPSIGLIEKLFKNYKLSKSNDLNSILDDLKDTLIGENYGEKLVKLPKNNFVFNPELINSSTDLIDLTARLKQNGRLDFSLLLYGVPGSSKTSYARYLAKELGLKVINKSYTELSSMWVGETEKNISKLFEEAERDKALIILDECDVLLQDRTKAFRSWETSQTEALLTAMEFHQYPFVMTTNLYNNLDPAIMRRILYKVKCDYLTQDQIIKAFKFFFNIDISTSESLYHLTSGDFSIVKKRAEFQNKLNDKDWLISELQIEMNQKKMNTSDCIIKL